MNKKLISFYKLIIAVLLIFLSGCSGRGDEVSDDYFAINPIDQSQLNVTAPEYGINFEPGTVLKIKWSFPSSISLVQISLYRKSEFKLYISVKHENTGSFEWKIPDDLANSVHYRVNVAVYNEQQINTFSDYFRIVQY